MNSTVILSETRQQLVLGVQAECESEAERIARNWAEEYGYPLADLSIREAKADAKDEQGAFLSGSLSLYYHCDMTPNWLVEQTKDIQLPQVEI